MQILIRFCLFFSLFTYVCPLNATDSNLDDLLNRAGTASDLIKSGDWILRTRHQSYGPNSRFVNALFRIEFDGEKIRVQREVAGRVTVYCSPYLTSEQSFFFASRPRSMVSTSGPQEYLEDLSKNELLGLPSNILNLNVGEHAGGTPKFSEFVRKGVQNLPQPVLESLTLYQKGNFDKLHSTKGISEDTTIPSVKTMGFVTDDVFFQSRHFVILSAYLKKLNNEHTTITQENFKGDACTVIRLLADGPIKLIQGNVTVRDESGNILASSKEEVNALLQKYVVHRLNEIYLDPAKNYAIRRMVLEDSLIKQRLVLENDMKQDAASQCWYPAYWKYEEYRDGELARTEENTLEIRSINKPIDPKRFTLESVGELKPGTPVIWELDAPPPGQGKLEWNGQSIIETRAKIGTSYSELQ